MICRYPYVQGRRAYGCGQCLPCRFNRRRVWAHRIMLEAMQYKDNTFVTLTYDDEHLPTPGGVVSLVPKDAQDWLKRFRSECYPIKIRYYLVGEYGDLSERPHYHVALFNYPNCRHGNSVYSRFVNSCCAACDLVRLTWARGNVFLGELSPHSAQYIAGYVTKKMTRVDDARLKGRYPEFARMSLRPGLGVSAMDDVASQLMTFGLEESQADVPAALRHGKRLLPLGRHLRRKLRERVGREAGAPQATLDEIEEELRPVFDAVAVGPSYRDRVREAIIEAGEGRYQQIAAKVRRLTSEKKL